MNYFVLLIRMVLDALIARSPRLLLALGIPTTALAVALGRTDESRPVVRIATVSLPLIVAPSVSDYAHGGGEVGWRYLDSSTSDHVGLVVRGGGRTSRPAWSPWRDDRGGSEVLAAWSKAPGESSLARIAIPDGTLLDCIPMFDLPVWIGAPCWFPDGSPRALFTAADGSLFRLDFHGRDADGRPSKPRPFRLTWETESIGDRPALMVDLAWPAAPCLGGRLVVSARPASPRPEGVSGDVWSLWWLRLDADSTSILAAGRLTRPSALCSEEVEQRHPIVGSRPDGQPVLAYLERPAEAPGRAWRLRVAPIALDDDDNPFTDAGSTTTLAHDSSATAPVLWPDGRGVSYVPSYDSAASAQVRGLPLTERHVQ